MIRADKIYLGKKYVNCSDAIKSTNSSIAETTPFMGALIEGFGIKDDRKNEVYSYNQQLKSLIQFAEQKGISESELIALGEEYKTLKIPEYFELINQATIEKELEEVINAE